MPDQLQAITNREKGQFPVSIGTSLALEGAAGIYPDRTDQVNAFLQPPSELWINIRTIFRNLHGSLKSEDRLEVLPSALHVGMIEDMSVVEAAVSKLSEGKTKVVFYGNNYTSLSQKFPKAQIKEPKTPNQLAYVALETATLKMLHNERGSQDIRYFGINITGNNPDAWMITHLPIDLLSKSQFKSLTLLESHTGVLKKPFLWYTKLTGGKDLPNIPFGPFALQVFGDSGNYFNTMPRSIKETVLGLADEFKWNATTTKDRIVLSIKSVKDPTTRTFLLSLV